MQELHFPPAAAHPAISPTLPPTPFKRPQLPPSAFGAFWSDSARPADSHGPSALFPVSAAILKSSSTRVPFLPVHFALWPYWCVKHISINEAKILEFKLLLGEISPVVTAEGVTWNHGEAAGWDTLMLVRYLIADTGHQLLWCKHLTAEFYPGSSNIKAFWDSLVHENSK